MQKMIVDLSFARFVFVYFILFFGIGFDITELPAMYTLCSSYNPKTRQCNNTI